MPGNVVNVPGVHGEALVERKAAALVNLRPTGEAGADEMAALLDFSVVRQILFEERARPDEAEFATENIPELRQLIETRAAQE